jgi:hypothetical protein
MTHHAVGRIYRSYDSTFLIISLQGQEFTFLKEDLVSTWGYPHVQCPVYARRKKVGHICRIDAEYFKLVIRDHWFRIPGRDLREMIRMRQIAAPIIVDPDNQPVIAGMVENR